MSIRTRLRVSAVLAVAVACAVAAALAAAVYASAQAEQEQERARAAAREVSLLLVLTQEYPRYFSARVADQWQHAHARLSDALAAAAPRVREGEALEQLRAAARQLPAQFARLRETPSRPARRIELLVDQLTNEAQALVDGVYEWSRAAAQAQREAQQRFRNVAGVSVGALALLLFGQAFWFARRVLRPLRRIEEATRAVEAGRLDVRIGIDSDDELGHLAHSFDAMTQSLAERTRQLQDEAARREASERRVRTITDNVPALVAYLSPQSTYEFVNAYYGRVLGVDAQSLIGRSLRETSLDAAALATREAHLARALAGEPVSFEIEWDVGGETRCLHTRYLPDKRPDGSVAGVYALSTDITAMKAAERQLHELARVDALTGLPNRRRFLEKLDEALARSPRAQRPMALMYLDIDHFKAINDTRGHGVGDAVLQEFAQRLRAAVRATDTVARLAGDEFVIIIEGLNAREEASLVAAKIVAGMAVPMAVDGGALQVTTSIGVAAAGPDMRSADELLARADAALYAAKRAGRNTFSLSDG